MRPWQAMMSMPDRSLILEFGVLPALPSKLPDGGEEVELFTRVGYARVARLPGDVRLLAESGSISTDYVERIRPEESAYSAANL